MLGARLWAEVVNSWVSGCWEVKIAKILNRGYIHSCLDQTGLSNKIGPNMQATEKKKSNGQNALTFERKSIGHLLILSILISATYYPDLRAKIEASFTLAFSGKTSGLFALLFYSENEITSKISKSRQQARPRRITLRACKVGYQPLEQWVELTADDVLYLQQLIFNDFVKNNMRLYPFVGE